MMRCGSGTVAYFFFFLVILQVMYDVIFVVSKLQHENKENLRFQVLIFVNKPKLFPLWNGNRRALRIKALLPNTFLC